MAERILQDIAEHKKRLAIAQINNNTAEKARAYLNLGKAYYSLRDFHQAIEYYEQFLSIAKEVGDRAIVGCAYNCLGYAYGSLGDAQSAIKYHKKHLRIAKEDGNKGCQSKALANLSLSCISLCEFQQAIEYINQHLAIAKEVNDRAMESKAYGNLSFVYISLCEFERAIKYTEHHLSIAREVGDREMEGSAYGKLGLAYHGLEDLPKAMEYHKKALSIAKEVGDKQGEAFACVHIGSVHYSLEDAEKAMGYYKRHLRLVKEIGDRKEQGRAYCLLGNCYRNLHDHKEAIECLWHHLSIAEELGDRWGEACAHTNLGRCLLDPNSLNEALYHFRRSVEIYDTIRASSIPEDKWKISFRTKNEFAYTHLWQVLVMLGRNYEALYAAERGRAQALLDALKETYDLTSLSPRSTESEEELRYISRKTNVLTVFLVIHLQTVNMWVLRKEGNPIFRRMRLDIGCKHKDSFAHLLDTALDKMRAGVGIRCENRSMDKMSDDSTSTTRDDDHTSEPSQETTDCLQPLYDAVIGPIEDLLDGDELIVVPDGALCKAPWAALSETLRIRTVPSLTSLKVITDSPSGRHSKSGALLVGDPCLEKVTKGGKPIYDPLKYARMEVEMIGKILESKPLTGEDATKEAVLQGIGSVALIHIAAHGRKETGEIVLAPDPRWESKPPKEEDCIMKMSDIQAVKLRARLVVLSCCHSGQGEVSSEGVVGMARAFLFAGARSVLAALWAIDDEATMMFMESFYQQLGSGESASVALQRAMKCLRDSHDYSAPKYWAPFVLMGDNVKIELEK